ncbi:putative Actin B [Blattamonas nauphoetae]|uniref:Actin B n=1 Tax=Blattamonas nauphoetae TaxID=2049346 RepID=A0ABQ9Y465_9EUKA|nr:putative Actin B [Blattamonas nauphoetae]
MNKVRRGLLQDVGAIAVDVGSHSTRSGFCSALVPSVVVPSYIGVELRPDTPENAPIEHYGYEGLLQNMCSQEVQPCMTDGIVSNWDVYEKLLKYSLFNTHAMNQDSLESNPLILSEPVWSPKSVRQRQLQVLFEVTNAKFGFLCRNSALSAFSSARPTSVVLDIGHHGSSATPVVEGFTLIKKSVRTSLGGEMLSKALHKSLDQEGTKLQPFYKRKLVSIDPTTNQLVPRTSASNNISTTPHPSSQINFRIHSLCDTIKESTFFLKPTINDSSTTGEVPFELPDGSIIDIDRRAYDIPDLLWKPMPTYLRTELKLNEPPPTLSSILTSAISSTDASFQRDLWENLIVVGATTCVKNFTERFCAEMTVKSPAAVKVSIVSSQIRDERRYSSWIGASILGSLESFQTKWISKAEYDEEGPAIWKEEELQIDPTIGKWHIIYPCYLNSKRKRVEGRKMNQSLCVEDPTPHEIMDACKEIGLDARVEPKRHPQDYFCVGRVRVHLRDPEEGNIQKRVNLHENMPNKYAMLKQVGEKLVQIRKTAKTQKVDKPTQGKKKGK